MMLKLQRSSDWSDRSSSSSCCRRASRLLLTTVASVVPMISNTGAACAAGDLAPAMPVECARRGKPVNVRTLLRELKARDPSGNRPAEALDKFKFRLLGGTVGNANVQAAKGPLQFLVHTRACHVKLGNLRSACEKAELNLEESKDDIAKALTDFLNCSGTVDDKRWKAFLQNCNPEDLAIGALCILHQHVTLYKFLEHASEGLKYIEDKPTQWLKLAEHHIRNIEKYYMSLPDKFLWRRDLNRTGLHALPLVTNYVDLCKRLQPVTYSDIIRGSVTLTEAVSAAATYMNDMDSMDGMDDIDEEDFLSVGTLRSYNLDFTSYDPGRPVKLHAWVKSMKVPSDDDGNAIVLRRRCSNRCNRLRATFRNTASQTMSENMAKTLRTARTTNTTDAATTPDTSEETAAAAAGTCIVPTKLSANISRCVSSSSSDDASCVKDQEASEKASEEAEEVMAAFSVLSEKLNAVLSSQSTPRRKSKLPLRTSLTSSTTSQK